MCARPLRLKCLVRLVLIALLERLWRRLVPLAIIVPARPLNCCAVRLDPTALLARPLWERAVRVSIARMRPASCLARVDRTVPLVLPARCLARLDIIVRLHPRKCNV